MSSSLLDAEEIGRGARQMVGAAKARTATHPIRGAQQIALIADDRAAERARPIACSRASDLRDPPGPPASLVGIEVDAQQLEAPIVDAASLRDPLREAWNQVLEVQAPHRGAVILAVGGPILSVLAMRLLGAAPTKPGIGEEPGPSKAPTAATRACSRRWRADRALVGEILHEDHGYTTLPVTDPIARGRAPPARRRDVVAVTIALSGDTSGWIRLIGHPELLVPPSMPLSAIPAPVEAIRQVLGEVAIELRVDLGTLCLSVEELHELKAGTVLPLDQSADVTSASPPGGRVRPRQAHRQRRLARRRGRGPGRTSCFQGGVPWLMRRRPLLRAADNSASMEVLLARSARAHRRARRVTMTMREVASRLGPGSVLTLSKLTGEPLDIRVNDRLVARGEAVAIGDRYGVPHHRDRRREGNPSMKILSTMLLLMIGTPVLAAPIVEGGEDEVVVRIEHARMERHVAAGPRRRDRHPARRRRGGQPPQSPTTRPSSASRSAG